LRTDQEGRRTVGGEFLSDASVRAVNLTIASQTEIVYVSLNPVRNDKPKSQMYFTQN